MSEQIHYAVGLTMFFVFFTAVLATGGFSDYVGSGELDKYNKTQEDLEISPDFPKIQTINIDLEDDIVEKQNVSIVNTSAYFNGSQDFETEKAIVLQNQSHTGYVSYEVPDADVINTKTQEENVIVKPRTELREGFLNLTENCLDNDETCHKIDGESSVTLNTDSSDVSIVLEEERSALFNAEDPVLYSIEAESGESLGPFETISRYLDSGLNSIQTWLQIISGLPPILTWLGVAFGVIAFLIAVMTLWIG